MHQLLILLSLVASLNALAAKPALETSGILIATQLTYRSESKTIETSKELIISQSNNGWTALITPKEGVVLLGRMVKRQETILQMEYLLIDTMAEPTVVSTPAIIARFGDESKISVSGPVGGPGDSKEKIEISLLARKTTFRPESESH